MLGVLFSPKKAGRHPLEVLLITATYTVLSFFVALWTFPNYSSVVAVFLAILPCMYVLQRALSQEEEKEWNYKSEKWLLKQHKKLVMLFLWIFLGFLLGFSLIVTLLPEPLIKTGFAAQIEVVQGIYESSTTGKATDLTGFTTILVNNSKVLWLSLLFAVFFGAGALFILAWNASVLGLVIGILARETLGVVALPAAFFKYALHGIPEMVAYFIGALAGGILFIAISKGDFIDGKRLTRVFLDCFILIIIAAGILVAAAFIEVTISPLL